MNSSSEETREVARLLKSEKVTERKKGRKDCETLLIKDKTTVFIPVTLGADLLRSVMRYEELEIKHARDKSKSVDIDIVRLFRRVVKHFVSTSQRHLQVLINTVDRERHPVIVIVIKWTLENIRDTRHDHLYREEHRGVLCDLLDYRVAHSLALAPHVLYSVFHYLQGAMIDRANVTSVIHQRMLRQLCRMMFSDEESVGVLIQHVVAWLCTPPPGGVFSHVSDDPKAEADFAVTVADCCTVLIEFHGLNISQVALRHMKPLLQTVIRQMPIQHSREIYREPYVRFLTAFLDLTVLGSCSLSSIISEGNPLATFSVGGLSSKVSAPATTAHASQSGGGQQYAGISRPSTLLTSLCTSLSNDDNLKSLIMSVTNSSVLRQTPDSYCHSLDDPKLRVYFELVAKAFCLEQLQYAHLCGNVDLQRTSSSTGTSSSDGGGTQSSMGPPGAFSGSSPDRDGTSMELLFSRLASFTMLPPSALGVGAVSGTTSSNARSATYSQLSRASSGAVHTSYRVTPGVFEAMLAVVQSLARTYSRGEFLMSTRINFGFLNLGARAEAEWLFNPLSRKERIDKLCELVALLREKLQEALALQNRQVSGALLCTLKILAVLAASLTNGGGSAASSASPSGLSSSSAGASLNAVVNREGDRVRTLHDENTVSVSVLNLRKEWSAVVHYLLQDTLMQKYGSSCKRATVSESFIALIGAIFEHDVLEPSSKWGVLEKLWASVNFVSDPRLCESATGVHLLATLIQRSKHEVPHNIGSAVVKALLSKVSPDRASAGSGNAHAPALTPSVGENTQSESTYAGTTSVLEALPVEFFQDRAERTLIYIVSWLEHQMDVRLATRALLPSAGEFCVSFGMLVQSVLPSPQREGMGDAPAAVVGPGDPILGYMRNEAGVNSSIGSPSCFFDDQYTRTSDLDNANHGRGHADSEIFQFLGTNLCIGPEGSLCTDSARSSDGGPRTGLNRSAAVSEVQIGTLINASSSTSFFLDSEERQKDDKAFCSKMENSLRVLARLREVLLSADVIRSQCSEAGDALAQWQLVSLIMSSVYASLSIDAINKSKGRSSACQESLKSLLLFASSSFWSLIDVQVAVMQFRIAQMRWSVTAEYFQHLVSVVQSVAHIHTFSTKNAKGVYKDASTYRHALCDEVVDLLKLIRDSAMTANVSMDGNAEPSGDTGAFEIDHSESNVAERGAAGGESKRRRINSTQSQDFDDDFADEGVKPGNQNQSAGSSRAEDARGEPLWGRTCKLNFTSEKQRVFSACSVIFMIASLDHESVYDILPILEERQMPVTSAGQNVDESRPRRFGMSLEVLSKASLLRGHPVECKLQTPTDVILSIASSLSSVYSLNAVYFFIMNLAWDIDWGPLGYYKILCVVYDLTSRSSFMLMSQTDETRSSILAKLVDIVFAQDVTLKSYPELYWRVRFMQIKCVGNFMAIQIQYKDEPGYFTLNKKQKDFVRDLFTNALQRDPDVRVRLCAAARVPQVMNFFRRADAIYETLVETSSLHHVPSLRSEEEVRASLKAQRDGDMDVAAAADSVNALYGGSNDPLRAVTNAVLIARMGISSPLLLQKSLLDLFRLCCSRMASYHCTTVGELESLMMRGKEAHADSLEDDVDGAGENAGNRGWLISFSSSAEQSPCFSSLLYRLLAFMSMSLGYATPELLLQEHSRWLLRAWFADLQWSLRSFPFQLFMPFAEHIPLVMDFFRMKDSSESHLKLSNERNRRAYGRFLSVNKSLIVPILCQIHEKSRRFMNISSFATDLGYSSTDQGIARLLLDTVLSIHASAYLMTAVPSSLVLMERTEDGTEENVDYGEISRANVDNMLSFLSGMVEPRKLFSVCFEKKSDLVQQMVSLFTFKAGNPYEPYPQAESIATSVLDNDSSINLDAEGSGALRQAGGIFMKGMSSICDRICNGKWRSNPSDEVDYDVSKLLRNCNVVEILSELNARLIETRCSRIQFAAVGVVNAIHNTLVAHLISDQICGYVAILAILTTLSRRALSPHVLRAVCDVTVHVFSQFAKASKEVLSRGDKRDKKKIADTCSTTLVEWFCLGASFLHALQACRFRCRFHEYDEDDMVVSAPNVHVAGELQEPFSSDGTFAEDEFVIVWYAQLVSLVEEESASADSLSKWKACINHCIHALCGGLDVLIGMAAADGSDYRLRLEDLLPLPRTFVESLSTARASTAKSREYFSLSAECSQRLYAMQHTDDGGVYGHSFLSKVRSFVSTVGDVVRGEPIPLPVIWFRLLNLSHYLDLGMRNGLSPQSVEELFRNQSSAALGKDALAEDALSVWNVEADLIGTFASCLIRLCTLHSLPTSVLQTKVMQFLGHLGPPDLHSLSHTGLPARVGDPLVESKSNIYSLKVRIFMRVCGLLWENPTSHRIASAALRDMNASGCLKDMHLQSVAPHISLSCETLLASYADIPLVTRFRQKPASALGDPWERSIWSTDGKSYASWVTTLANHAICTAYPIEVIQGDTGESIAAALDSRKAKDKKSSPGKGKPTAEGSESSGRRVSQSHANFIIPLRDLCLHNPDVAEALLPLILVDLVNSNPLFESKVAGLLTRYTLSPQCKMLEATRLGCAILIMFLRQSIDAFSRTRRSELQANAKSDGARSQAQKTQQSAQQTGRIEIFTCTLSVDLAFAAQAAYRCGCVCTALLLEELSQEHTRDALTSNVGSSSRFGTFPSGGGSTLTDQMSSSAGGILRGNGNGSAARRAEAVDLLMQIFQTTHDPDALLGMLTEGSPLDVQAMVYVHTGNWVAALSTYESLVQDRDDPSRSMSPSISAAAPHLGMAQALQGLGSQHVLTAYASWCQAQGAATAIGGHVGISRLPEIMGLASEGSWRNLHAGPSATSAGLTLGGLHSSSSASAADASLREWGELSSFSSGGSASAGSVTSAAVFNSSLASALKDMSRGDYSTALHRTRQCAAEELLPHILRVQRHESACGLIPSLVRAQQLYELQEACFLLQERNYSPLNTADGGRAQAVEKLMQRWGSRLNSTGGGASIALSESVLSLRLSLASQLLERGLARPDQALRLLDQLYSCIPQSVSSGSSAAAHALSPLAYKIKATLVLSLRAGFNSLDSPPSGAPLALASSTQAHKSSGRPESGAGHAAQFETFSADIWRAEWALHECRLLWRKGLEKLAVSNLNRTVIGELRRLYDASVTFDTPSSTSLSKRAPKNSNKPPPTSPMQVVSGAWTRRISNILSGALRQGGEWMGMRRGATGAEILSDYLEPAVGYAEENRERIRSYNSMAAFQDALHASCKARVDSEEHKHLTRVNKDRVEELVACTALRDSMTKEKRDADVNLRRHVNVLQKEIAMDSNDLRTAEESVKRFLLSALKGYAQVLALSDGTDLDVVFRVISLWLKNRDDKDVSLVLQDIISSTRSYKFVPLSYQILSMLGTAPSPIASSRSATNFSSLESSISSGSASSSSASAASSFPLVRGNSLPGPDDGKVNFSTLIRTLVLQMAKDHPYHVLPQLFALVNNDKDDSSSSSSSGGAGGRVDNTAVTARNRVAKGIINELKGFGGGEDDPAAIGASTSKGRASTRPGSSNAAASSSSRERNSSNYVAGLVTSLEVLLRAYITLANSSVEQFTKINQISCIKFSEFQGSKGKHFHQCLEPLGRTGRYTGVITLTPRLQKDCDYFSADAEVVYIQSILPEFSITDSGLSRPKIIQIIASNGCTYKELVKSNDDMRQDAVMEQVFDNVNITLAQDPETRKRKLRMRTYKCIPMTPQTGVIQWVENARPFGDFLVTKETGAHARYHPHDWTHSECREYLKEATDNDDKERRLLEIYAHFHPAFRFFFIEKYPDPARWLSCRMAYTRSVAVASMLGYVLAIGDRHAQNIMLDSSTAEVVHIDFGIVFDQGKVLPTPETVPFRLTRDVVDGMGITGVEGTFRKSCEEVLRALRTNSTQIMTILEVVIHDPLYKWSLSPVEARNKQEKGRPPSRAGTAAAAAAAAASAVGAEGEDGTLIGVASSNATRRNQGDHIAGRDAAERTLMRIRNKLLGNEDSAGEGLGVEGQVEQLITAARDTKNLSRIFVGWCSWV